MATLLRARRIVNPGKRRRGNIGQIVTLGLNPGRRKNSGGTYRTIRKKWAARKKGDSSLDAKSEYKVTQHHKRHSKRYTRLTGRSSNPMSVITIGKIQKRKRTRNTMAKTRRRNTSRRRAVAVHTRRRRRVSNPVTHRRRRNYSHARVTRRRRNGVFSFMKRKVHRRRRNPGMLGTAGSGVSQAMGIVGGALVTNTALNMLPASLSGGMIGYFSTAAIAILQGMAVGKIFKSPKLANDMQIGGFVILALKVMKDFFPSIGNPFGVGGMGLLAPTSFYNPQVPIPNSMVQFQLPAAVSGAIPAPVANAGMGRTMRAARQGRM